MQLAKKLIVFFIPILFLIFSLVTIDDYSVNWDAHTHYERGQAYLNFFLPLSCPRESFYPTHNLSYAFEIDNSDAGHPPLYGILAALSNKIFYQCLDWLNDLASYFLPIILFSFITILVVSLWSQQLYGTLAAVVAGLSLATYPLFWAESHNNPKDPMETAFFTLTLFGFYQGITKRSTGWILLSAVAAGFALGTKFNILFAGLIMGVWLLVYSFGLNSKYPITNLIRHSAFYIRHFLSNLPHGLIAALLLFVPIMLGILYASWPFLWQDPLRNFSIIYQYYRQIGIGTRYQPDEFFIHGWNTYPLLWVIYTTPLVTLGLALIGIIRALVKMLTNDKNKLMILLLLWLIVPTWRVSPWL